MGAKGTNLGNILDNPQEGSNPGGEKMQKIFFTDLAEKGFSTVRIPVHWDTHTQGQPPYKIDADWLDRIEEVVGWCLDANLVCCVNFQHDDWIGEHLLDPSFKRGLLPRFQAIWEQIATRFEGRAVVPWPGKGVLIYEAYNEPHPLSGGNCSVANSVADANMDKIHSTALSTIRSHDERRIVPPLVARTRATQPWATWASAR